MEVKEAGQKWKQLEQDIAHVIQELLDEFQRNTGLVVKSLTIKTITQESLGQHVALVIQGVSVDCTISKH